MAMTRYMVVVERGETSWGAHVPDLSGCVAVRETREDVLRLIREAIEFHIDSLRQDGLPVPTPSSEGEFVEVGPRNSGAGVAVAEHEPRLLEAWNGYFKGSAGGPPGRRSPGRSHHLGAACVVSPPPLDSASTSRTSMKT
jgi:predicted RNase H-like HicB family nuclease